MNVEHFVMFLDISHTFDMTRLFVSFRQSVATRNLSSLVYSDISHTFDMTRLFVSLRQSVATRNLPSLVYSDISHSFDMTDGIWGNAIS